MQIRASTQPTEEQSDLHHGDPAILLHRMARMWVIENPDTWYTAPIVQLSSRAVSACRVAIIFFIFHIIDVIHRVVRTEVPVRGQSLMNETKQQQKKIKG